MWTEGHSSCPISSKFDKSFCLQPRPYGRDLVGGDPFLILKEGPAIQGLALYDQNIHTIKHHMGKLTAQPSFP